MRNELKGAEVFMLESLEYDVANLDRGGMYASG